jgi:hypothetical protein
MRDLTIRALFVVCSGLSLSCDLQSAPLEPTATAPGRNTTIVPSNSAAVVREPVSFSLAVVDVERGLTALVTSGPSVLNCGSAEVSEHTDYLEVTRPDGAVHSRLLGRNLSVGVWLEPFANQCLPPFAIGQADATLVQTNLARLGPGASLLSWHARGTVTAIENGQRYRLLITIHQSTTPDGTTRGDRADIRLIPVAR